MTAAALSGSPRRHVRLRGLDRVVERVGLTLVAWSRQHAERAQPTHERQQLLVREAAELERRERARAAMATLR